MKRAAGARARASAPALTVVKATPPEITDNTITEVVEAIRAAQAKHGFALAEEIGRLVVERFYGGDIDVFRERGAKDASLRKLADRKDLPMKFGAIYNAVATYEFLQRNPGVY